jgi:GNAT superfamily N-acetyltransferase
LRHADEPGVLHEEVDLENRLASRSDLTRIIEIRHKAFSLMAPSSYTEAEVKTLLDDYQEEEFLDMISDHRLFVASASGVIQGVAAWAGTNIRHVYVNPEYSGRGIGTELVTIAEVDYQERTRQTFINAGVTLYARGFYEKCGYVMIAKARDWDGSEYWQMRKELVDVHNNAMHADTDSPYR